MTIPLPLQQLVSRSQAIGAHTDWVVFGGGNTSSKGEITDYLGRLREVLWVKGSGADMKDAVAVDYPGLYLQELIALMDFDSMDDEKMVDFVTRALVDPTSRRPSIETLLHAFLPAKHIDHVHADAICALTNHSAGEKAVREALGEGVAYVDWKRPGFELSKLVSQLKDSEAVVPADAVSFTLLQEQLHSVLGTLSEREAGVVKMRFGLTDGQPKTLDEIGKVYSVTRERIRQIESKTMSKLRHPSRSQVLRDYLD